MKSIPIISLISLILISFLLLPKQKTASLNFQFSAVPDCKNGDQEGKEFSVNVVDLLKEYKIDISVVNTGEKQIKITIITDFPDGTNLLLSVYRIYYVRGDTTKYSGDLGEIRFKYSPLSDHGFTKISFSS